MAKYRGYIGTYTKADSVGIYTFELDTEKKALSTPKPAAKLGSPTYLNIAKDNDMLYAVVKDGDKGGVAAYRIDGSTGEPDYRQPADRGRTVALPRQCGSR